MRSPLTYDYRAITVNVTAALGRRIAMSPGVLLKWRRRHLPCWGLLHLAWPFVLGMVLIALVVIEAAAFLQATWRLFVQNVRGASVKGINTAHRRDAHAIKRGR
jgi:hypothetical protein